VGQAITIALVIACGVAVFLASMSCYRALRASQTTYYERYRFPDVFAHARRIPTARAEALASIEGVVGVEARVVSDVTLDLPGLAEPAIGHIVSLPDFGEPSLAALHLRSGRMPDPHVRDEVLLNEPFATAHAFREGDTFGAIFEGKRRELRVVGIALSPEFIFQMGPNTFFPDDLRYGVMWMRKGAFAGAVEMDGAVNDVVLSRAPGYPEAAILAAVDAALAPYGGLGAYGREKQLSHHFVSSELDQLESMATFLPSVFLAVAAFLLNVVLSRLVGTEREIIAALKALGFSNAAIARHYLELVFAIVLFGTALGVALGAYVGRAFTALYADFYHFPVLEFRLEPSLVALSAMVSLAAGASGALLAVRRAVSLPPAEAMRPPAPASYRPTILERLGLARMVGAAARMIVRDLERRPLRALFSTVAIAFSVAIVVSGTFTRASIDELLDHQFARSQREDMHVSFRRAVPRDALSEIARMPSVLRVEPTRSVPVELLRDHRRERTALVGVPAASELRVLVDEAQGVVRLPDEGLVLSRRLATKLDVREGDELSLALLEGDRSQRRATVVAIVDERIGSSAYMSLPAVHRLLREEPVVNGALLATDGLRRSELEARLKAAPLVAGVTQKSHAIAAFEETSGKSMLVFSFVLAAFAGVIALGVVYNGARIALAERARELASLRVLGFTRAEVSRILLGELFVHVGLGIPLGFLLGRGLAEALVASTEGENFSMRAVIPASVYAQAGLVVLAAAIGSALLVRRRVDRLDLVAVLKTRE
jgi:putative ABC transport system permease protein